MPMIALMHRRLRSTSALLAAALVLAAGHAGAERADRKQPLAFVADSARVDELKQTNILSGNVEITKGSIVIRAERVEVRQSREGWQTAVATGNAGKRAFFRQKREGSDEVLEGEAERLEYDSRADTVKLVNQAVMRRFRGSTLADEVAGSTISYDNGTEVFQVVGGAASAAAPGRVRGVLTPRENPSVSEPAVEARP
jgi:lipopolysaccharide export system protein LptA